MVRRPEEYRESLVKMRPNIYMRGKLVGRDHPAFEGGINVISKTFELATDPDWDGLMTATSHLTGKKINRFTHINQSAEDLLAKQRMIRAACRLCGGCIQRCMGCDAINALSVVTWEVDQKYGTDYHKRFTEYLRFFQENDIVAAMAQTDVKGHRMLRPHQQPDPDVYVRVVEKRSDGIIVKGAKNHITIAPYADEIIVVPTRAMTEKDKDWAVAFAIPADAENIKLVARAHERPKRVKMSSPLDRMGVADCMVIFDNTFVPWDRVFLCGEWEFAGIAALLAGAIYHRHSYTGCKAAMSDIMLGAAALVAEYNGIMGAAHVRDKLATLIETAELVFAAGVASAIYGIKHPSGTYIPNPTYVNAGRLLAGERVYHEYEIVAELAGGLPATIPYEEDYLSPEVGDHIRKYVRRVREVSAEDTYRCFLFLEDLLSSALTGYTQIAGLHGGGSPVMERIVMVETYNIEEQKNLVRYLAGIAPEYKPKLPEYGQSEYKATR